MSNADALIRIRNIVGDPKSGVMPLVAVSKATLWAWVKEGQFPPPAVRIGAATFWKLSEVQGWISNQTNEAAP